jgi:hypothetical protein
MAPFSLGREIMGGVDVERVLERGGIIERGTPIGPLQLVRVRKPITFGCVRCGSAHRSRSVGIVEDRELICKACYQLLAEHFTSR